jgi:hypothetical protein
MVVITMKATSDQEGTRRTGTTRWEGMEISMGPTTTTTTCTRLCKGNLWATSLLPTIRTLATSDLRMDMVHNNKQPCHLRT